MEKGKKNHPKLWLLKQYLQPQSINFLLVYFIVKDRRKLIIIYIYVNVHTQIYIHLIHIYMDINPHSLWIYTLKSAILADQL